MYNECGIWVNDEVSKIEQLKPLKIYNFFQMNSIFENSLGYKARGCEETLVKLGYDIPESEYNDGTPIYCDFWHYQLNSVFSNEVINDSINRLYVGTVNGIDYSRLGKQPNDWQKMMLLKWNELFSHLANDYGVISVYISW